jgi:SAM-dependent methyltransferase
MNPPTGTGGPNAYVIRGGLEGRERLRVLARVMHPTSMALLDRCGLRDGLTCLDVGCGGGDVTLELARRVGPGGRVVGIDIDDQKVQMARAEAQQQGIGNVEFLVSDARETSGPPAVDFVYARFLLTHLSDPAGMVDRFHGRIRPGGTVGVEDIDFSGHFTYPASKAFQRYHELYSATVTRRGGDPNIGPRVPLLLRRAGFDDIRVSVVQPMALRGEAKMMNAMTLEAIAAAVLEDGLASREEIDDLVRELYAFAADPATLAGLPRIVQVSGKVQ